MTNLSAAQLRQAANLKDQIESLERKLAGLLGSTSTPTKATGKRGRKPMSAAQKAAHSLKMKTYWAKRRAGKTTFKSSTTTPTPTKTKAKRSGMSEAQKKKVSARMKAYWAGRKKTTKTAKIPKIPKTT